MRKLRGNSGNPASVLGNADRVKDRSLPSGSNRRPRTYSASTFNSSYKL